jgi:hypothetical protein
LTHSSPVPVIPPEMNTNDTPLIQPLPFLVAEDERLRTPSLKQLGKVFWDLKLPLKFRVEEEQLKLGQYTGTQM